MKVLLDTNIIIHREATTVKKDNIGLLFKWFDKLNYEKCCHPLTRDELAKNINTDTAKTLEVKLDNYNELNTQAPIATEVEGVGNEYDKDENDRNDTLLLNEVYNKRVDFLITEDNKIHLKAEKLKISDKVFKIDDFLHKVTTENPNLCDYKVLSVRQTFFGNLKINDSFFDSFKKDYKEFETWFNNKSNDPAYVCMDEHDKITAFLYLKIENRNENYSDITPVFGRKRRLKISTCKILVTGYKLGERFLKIIFDNALLSNVEEIYVTIFNNSPENQDLINLLKDWGFVKHGYKGDIEDPKASPDGQEEVYVRDFSKRFDDRNIKHSYPFVSKRSRKFIVPIYPAYHTELLPDSILMKIEQPEDFLENKVHRNAIRKIYNSKGFCRDMKKGDIIVFYRTGGMHKSVVTTVGMVDSVIDNIPDVQKYIDLCGTRNVLSEAELLKQWDNSEPDSRPFIVNFLYVYSFSSPYLNLSKLIEMGIIEDAQDAPRGFKELSDDKFNLLMKENDASHIVVD